jgi:glycosyltransferase involved in cell wall biosynthesis
MKIAIVHENWDAGAARCARDLERGLAASHELIYFPHDGCSSAGQILRELSSFHPDVINCHSFYSHLPYSFLFQVSRRYPTCFTVHDPRPIGTIDIACWNCDRNTWCLRCPLVRGRSRKLLANKYFWQRSWKRFQHLRCSRDLRVVSPSHWLRGRLDHQELRRFELTTIPYGIDLERFRPIADARQQLGLSPDMPLVLHIAASERTGQYSERKGLRYLEAAFQSHVIPRIPSAVLAVAGEDTVPNHPWVRPLGKLAQSDVPIWLSAADIFVSATLADNLPYTILEAMGCGRPVIASAIGGVPEEVVDGENGLLFPARDSDALGNAVTGLLLDPERRRTYGAASRRRAETLFAMPRFVADYESLFQEMIAARRAPRSRSRCSGKLISETDSSSRDRSISHDRELG